MNEQASLKSMLKDNLKLIKELRSLEIHYDASKCKGTWECYNVCPVGCWTPDKSLRKAVFHDPKRCIACGACVLQCPEKAIELR